MYTRCQRLYYCLHSSMEPLALQHNAGLTGLFRREVPAVLQPAGLGTDMQSG